MENIPKMDDKPLQIGDKVVDLFNNEGVIIAYSFRDSDWENKRNYKVKFNNWFIGKKWLVYPSITKIVN